MSTLYHIVDIPLPPSQDFSLLKEQGLTYIQKHMGNEWTNLNAGDPGVTILDQVCFALTELGYCNDFSIADILTQPNGKLRIKDQFYLPQDILTTSPVTLKDYRKFVIDGVAGVDNVCILPYGITRRMYKVWLLPSVTVSSEQEPDLCNAAFFLLNKRRNLSEFFNAPEVLQPKSYLLGGQVTIARASQLNALLAAMQQQVRNFIFPKVQPASYDELEEEGMSINDILNGPLLKNGWIRNNSLGEKKDSVRTLELAPLLEAIEGVGSVSGLYFIIDETDTQLQKVECGQNEVISFDLLQSVAKGKLQFFCNGRPVMPDASKKPALLRTAAIPPPPLVFGAHAGTQLSLPKGKFRDIDNYYSIQNTFPEIFAVGADSIVANASDFQVAQSRQLKGYLTLFDQLLANQFSQLANIGKLFSFKNTLNGTPTAHKEYYETEDSFDRHNPEYPVPYLAFSPTYFYQGLYDIPHIKPLLKGHDMFHFSVEGTSEKEQERNSWDAYKLYPYNPYMRELMLFMEDEHINLERRNALLDHLLARHGESPVVIDAMIEGSNYAGDYLKDKVIYKSLYLQNLGLLSYFRSKAYNYLGALPVLSDLPEVGSDAAKHLLSYTTRDFIFNTGLVNRLERLTESDFINYSALELKMRLLLGLRAAYRDYIIERLDTPAQISYTLQIKLALWMITQRKGALLIETGQLKYNNPSATGNSDNFSDLEIIFPDFVDELNTPQFKKRVELFLEHTLPAHITCKCHYVSASALQQLIPQFADWHNDLIYQDPDAPKRSASTGNPAREIITQLNAIYANEKK